MSTRRTISGHCMTGRDVDLVAWRTCSNAAAFPPRDRPPRACPSATGGGRENHRSAVAASRGHFVVYYSALPTHIPSAIAVAARPSAFRRDRSSWTPRCRLAWSRHRADGGGRECAAQRRGVDNVEGHLEGHRPPGSRMNVSVENLNKTAYTNAQPTPPYTRSSPTRSARASRNAERSCAASMESIGKGSSSSLASA